MAFDNQTAVISESTADNNEIVAAVAGKRIAVVGYSVVNCVATAQAVTWKSGTTAVTGKISLPSAIGYGSTLPIAPANKYWFITAVGEALNLTSAAATEVGGVVAYKLV